MIELSNNKLIEEPIIDILYDLRRDLIKNNINKLCDIIVKGPNALITCPNHKDGLEAHPSCYVRLTEGDKVKEGTVYCFTCKYNVDLKTFISNCFNYDDKGKFGEQWLLDHCRYSYLTERRALKKIEVPTNEKELLPVKYVSEEELAQYRFYHPYMFQRKLTEDIINKYDIGFDKKMNALTFPVYDANNKCLFVIKRSVNFKKFYIPQNIDKGIFGLYQLPKNCNQVVVCESVINALTAISYGYPAIALFGTGSTYQYKLLKNENIRNFILCFDGDTAGRNGALKFKNYFKTDSLIIDLIMPQGKDLNDLSKEEFEQILKNKLNISVY